MGGKFLLQTLRLTFMSVMVAISRDRTGPIASTRTGVAFFFDHLGKFMTKVFVLFVSSIIMLLPAILILYIGEQLGITLFAMIFVAVLFAMTWVFSALVENMYVAQIYLWANRWNQEREKALKNNQNVTKLEEKERPIMLKNVFET